jgi:hypothetical protein
LVFLPQSEARYLNVSYLRKTLPERDWAFGWLKTLYRDVERVMPFFRERFSLAEYADTLYAMLGGFFEPI